ncbi:MAG: A/G-specific adenine glycosylase [Luteolibacter sp.]
MPTVKSRCVGSLLDNQDDFRRVLAVWFGKVGKDFPWRRTHEPYAILVSEMMLQQTQVATVLGKGYYTRFLEKFPNLETLAEADDTYLLKAWEGLGYYRRARMLRETARAIISEHEGRFPKTEKELLALPGIGPYTCSALLSFAFGKSSALVDGNVSRILSRLTDDDSPIDSTPTIRKHRELALALCDPQNPRIHHYAMMELGQTICRPGFPHCLECPVSKYCAAKSPESLPVKKKRPKITAISENAVWSRNSNGEILLHRESGSRRNGLWKLPLRSDTECETLQLIAEDTYAITRYKVSLRVHLTDYRKTTPKVGDDWIPLDRLESLPVAAPFKRMITRLLTDF